jgi:hypothetical protein
MDRGSSKFWKIMEHDLGLLRARFLLLGVIATTLAAAHFADHVIRGNIVVAQGLDPNWNHSGWPFQPHVTPFTPSLFIVSGLLLGGIGGSLRGKLWAGYWLTASILLLCLVSVVHFFSGHAEIPYVIFDTYRAVGNPVAGVVAVAVLFSIIGVLSALAILAIFARRKIGQW